MKETALKAAAGLVLGTVLGWTTNALTLGGRVTAIEASLVRIEAHLYRQPVDQVARK